MKINDAKLLDYVENNLSDEEKDEIDKALLISPELKKKVNDIKEAIGISSMAYQHEKEEDNFSFYHLKREVDKKFDEQYKDEVSSKKKSKNSVIDFIKDKISFKIGIPQISAVASILVLGYFSVTTISNLGLDSQMQYTWESSNKNIYRSGNKEGQEEITSWSIKDLGIVLKIQSISSDGKIKSIKMNDKISFKNLIKVQVRSDLYDVALKYPNKEDKGIIKIAKDTIMEPLLLKYNKPGKLSITISNLEDKITFNVNFDFELID